MSILRWVVKSNSTLPNDATVGASATEVHVSASLQSPADSCQLLGSGEPSPTTVIEQEIIMEATKANQTSEVNVKAADFLLPECPNRSFPKQMFGKQRRAFSPSWYSKYPSLHYVEAKDCVLCFYCKVADKRALMLTHNNDDVFSVTGFSNWKNALEKFENNNIQNLIVKQCWLYQFQELPGILENY